MPSRPRTVGVYVYDEVEVLDFFGPFEVFSVASRVVARDAPGMLPPFEVFTVSRTGGRIAARGRLTIAPAYAIDGHPDIDVLIIPGGSVDAELARPDVIEWIRARAMNAELVASVCTGAFLLAEAGLLDGLEATTHWEDADHLAERYRRVNVLRDTCGWIDQGHIVTAAGISAGIDMALHLVERLLGRAMASRTARQMEYRWNS